MDILQKARSLRGEVLVLRSKINTTIEQLRALESECGHDWDLEYRPYKDTFDGEACTIDRTTRTCKKCERKETTLNHHTDGLTQKLVPEFDTIHYFLSTIDNP